MWYIIIESYKYYSEKTCIVILTKREGAWAHLNFQNPPPPGRRWQTPALQHLYGRPGRPLRCPREDPSKHQPSKTFKKKLSWAKGNKNEKSHSSQNMNLQTWWNIHHVPSEFMWEHVVSTTGLLRCAASLCTMGWLWSMESHLHLEMRSKIWWARVRIDQFLSSVDHCFDHCFDHCCRWFGTLSVILGSKAKGPCLVGDSCQDLNWKTWLLGDLILSEPW